MIYSTIQYNAIFDPVDIFVPLLLLYIIIVMNPVRGLPSAHHQRSPSDYIDSQGLSILRFCTRTLAYAYSQTRRLSKYTPFEVVRERGRSTRAL